MRGSYAQNATNAVSNKEKINLPLSRLKKSLTYIGKLGDQIETSVNESTTKEGNWNAGANRKKAKGFIWKRSPKFSEINS
jgi:hypothetical protein